MTLFEELANRYPELKRKLIMAKIKREPEDYLRTTVMMSLLLATTFAFSTFLFAAGLRLSLWYVPAAFLVTFLAAYEILLRLVDVRIRKIAKDIDREVLFAGRFLLVKLNAGRPLILALKEASESYGVANKYFKEIIHDIDLGTPLEEALDKASRYSPSEEFRKIIFQISNALKIGVDVTTYLEALLDELAASQLIQIQRYGRKLNSLTMFFMLFSIVIPSLGITLMITIISIANISFDRAFFFFLAFILLVIEYLFITVFKYIRPTVNI